MTAPDFTDAAFPADPYPGARPANSFVHVGQAGFTLRHDSATPSRWRLSDPDSGPDLDTWLAQSGTAPMAERLPVLAYGSNANPSKITWLREELGLQGPAVVLRVSCSGIAAVWSAGVRARDQQRPAVIAAMDGITEHHAVWYVTPDQRRVLDACEGRGERYRLSWIHTPTQLENGQRLPRVLAYTARPEVIGHQVPLHLNRSPLLVHGQLVRCADIPQERARHLNGTPAESDGLDAIEVHGEP